MEPRDIVVVPSGINAFAASILGVHRGRTNPENEPAETAIRPQKTTTQYRAGRDPPIQELPEYCELLGDS